MGLLKVMEPAENHLNLPAQESLLEELPEWRAELRHIYLSSGHDYWGKQGEGRLQHGIQEVSEAECVVGRGLRGDRYFEKKPGHKGQVTFFDAQVVEDIRTRFRLPKLPASVFRRNLVVSGICLSEWLGRRFVFQGIVFEGTQECKPCHWMDRVIADGAEAYLSAVFRGGLRAKIITGGMLKAGQVWEVA